MGTNTAERRGTVLFDETTGTTASDGRRARKPVRMRLVPILGAGTAVALVIAAVSLSSRRAGNGPVNMLEVVVLLAIALTLLPYLVLVFSVARRRLIIYETGIQLTTGKPMRVQHTVFVPFAGIATVRLNPAYRSMMVQTRSDAKDPYLRVLRSAAAYNGAREVLIGLETRGVVHLDGSRDAAGACASTGAGAGAGAVGGTGAVGLTAPDAQEPRSGATGAGATFFRYYCPHCLHQTNTPSKTCPKCTHGALVRVDERSGVNNEH